MNKFLVLILIVSMATFAKQQDDECGSNATYNPCGSACPATCTSSRGTQACPTVCVPGCFCKAGYVFVSLQRRQCVHGSDCPR